MLKWDKAHEDKGKHTKFQKMWLGPFEIIEKIGSSMFILQDLSGKRDCLPVNGLILKNSFLKEVTPSYLYIFFMQICLF